MRALSNLYVTLKFKAYGDADYQSAELIASFSNPETGQRVEVTDLFSLDAAEVWLRTALAECIKVRLAARSGVSS